MIEWNDGLSLGVKVIDDDHKKLLSIIDELSIAINSNKTKEVINDIFDDLEKYVIEHFHREESFLRQHNLSQLDDHIATHNSFVVKILELKAKSLKDNFNAQDVVLYLIDWLFEHILIEDTLAIDAIFKDKTDENKVENLTIFQESIKYVTNTFSFSKRLLISSIVPILGMIILAFVILFDNYQKNEDMLKSATLTNTLSDINNLAHTMQVERGLSCGHLSSSGDKFKNNLEKQRKIVNDAIYTFKNKIKSIDNNKLITIQSNINRFKVDINSLKDFRESVNLRELNQDVAIKYYTNMIKNILNITPKIATNNLDTKISSSILTLSTLLYYKETLGLKRAIGTTIIEHKGIDKDEYIKFMQLLSTQAIYFDEFEQTSLMVQNNTLNLIIRSQTAKEVDFYQQKIQSFDFEKLDSSKWFELMSSLIDDIKLFEDKLLKDIEQLIKDRIHENKINLFLWLIYIAVVFIFTILIIYIFEKSSKIEIYKFIDAMDDLSKGGRSFKLKKPKKQDEIAQMYSSYEMARQELLKGDIYMQLFLSKKDMEIEEQERQNSLLEEMASIDPLTSCVNRRKFEEVSKLELERSIRYKSDLSFLMLDIDHFKAVNDTYGHAIGDEVLKHFSGVCLEMARNLDVVARVGGEEFVVMLPQTNSEGAFIFAERFRKKIFDATIVIQNQTIKYSVSIGIAVLNETSKDVKTILDKADKALYEAKDTGRNKSIVFHDKV